MPSGGKLSLVPAVSHGWPKSVRLCRNEDIRETIRRGRCYPGGWFRLFFWPGSQPSTRFGISVRKKVGNACVRNRERRRLREALRLARESWPPHGWAVVIIDRAAPPHLPGSERQEILRGLLARIKRHSGKNSHEIQK